MSDCNHTISERETACADGMCPICLAVQHAALIAREQFLTKRLAERGTELENIKAQHTALMEAARACQFATAFEITNSYDMIEMAARALHLLDPHTAHRPWGSMPDDWQYRYRRNARAALEAALKGE